MSILSVSGHVGPTQLGVTAGSPKSSGPNVVKAYVTAGKKQVRDFERAQQGGSSDTRRATVNQKQLNTQAASGGLGGQIDQKTSVDDHLKAGFAGLGRKSELAKSMASTRVGGTLREIAAMYDGFKHEVGLNVDVTV